MKRAAVFGGAGFIGSHLCARLVQDGYEVTAFDRKHPEFGWAPATRYHICDLREPMTFMIQFIADQYDEVYQLAAEMGGAGFVFTGQHDADIMANSVRINLNCIDACRRSGNNPKVFFSSSACVYSSIVTAQSHELGNMGKAAPGCREDENINPDSDYGLEKLFSEKLYDAFGRNYGLDVRVGRFHNIFGPYGTWTGGREKAPAAICRKIAELPEDGGTIDVWGTGKQTRSFLYVEEAVEAMIRLMQSNYRLPVNIGSSESVTIDKLVAIIAVYAQKRVTINHVPGPVGVDGRNSNNDLIEYHLGWRPSQALWRGLRPTYDWIKQEVDKARESG